MTNKEIKAENVLEYLTEMEKLFGHDDGAREHISNTLAYFSRHGARIETEREINKAVDETYSLTDLSIEAVEEQPTFMDLFNRFAGQMSFLMKMARATTGKDHCEYLEAKLKDIINDETAKNYMLIPTLKQLSEGSVLSASVELFNKMTERAPTTSILSDKQLDYLINMRSEQIAELQSKIDDFDYEAHAKEIAQADYRVDEAKHRLSTYRTTHKVDPSVVVLSMFENDYEAQLLYDVQIAESAQTRVLTENDAERWNKQVIALHEEMSKLELERAKRKTHVKTAEA